MRAVVSPPVGRLAGSGRRVRRHLDVLVAVGLGGGLGSVARFLVGHVWPAEPGSFPWATFTINATGCLALGGLMTLMLDVWPPHRYLRPFLGVGLCGGFTTFSAYTLELRDLAAAGDWWIAGVYAGGTLVTALAAVWAGVVCARLVTGLPVRHRNAARGRDTPTPKPR